MELGATLLGAVLVFAATNVDDVLLLSLLFANAQLQSRSIVAGQFLGIATLVAASALCALAAVAVPDGVLRYLGLGPLAIGLYKLIALWRGQAADDDDGPTGPRAGLVSQVLLVSGVTIANGSDNLGAYIPMFAAQPRQIPVYAVVFALMTALWCVLGYALVLQRAWRERLRRYGHIILPFVLILLGLEILLT